MLPPDLIAELDDIGRSHTADAMLTWVKCRQIGNTFHKRDRKLHKVMRRYLATSYRLSTNQIGNHLHVYAVMDILNPPDETLEILPWSVVHIIRKRHKLDYGAAAREVGELLDCDRSLIAQRAANMVGKGEKARTLWATVTKAVPRELRKLTEPPNDEQRATILQAVREALRTYGREKGTP